MHHRINWRIFLIRLIFPLAYAGFFAVQFYIHFDTTLTGSAERYQIIQCRIQTNIPSALQKTGDNQPVKTKFRLCRSFQPAVIPTLPEMSSDLVIRQINVTHVSYVNPFIGDPFLNVRLLRGPPFNT
jgi:hypothetical protein